MMMTGRPLTSLWLCRYALPVDASGATSASDGVLPPRKSCRHSIMRRSFCAASCTSSFLGRICSFSSIAGSIGSRHADRGHVRPLHCVWWSHLLELDVHFEEDCAFQHMESSPVTEKPLLGSNVRGPSLTALHVLLQPLQGLHVRCSGRQLGHV